MLLYHFTAFLHLPEIMRDGLNRGEIPINGKWHYDRLPQAINLTRLSARKDQAAWGALRNIIDKTKVRITLDVDRNTVESFKDVRKRLKIPSSYARQLGAGADPYNHFFFFGVIPPDQFQLVEVWHDDCYKALNETELAELIVKIESERGNLVFSTVKGYPCLELKEGVSDSWLVDGGEGYSLDDAP